MLYIDIICGLVSSLFRVCVCVGSEGRPPLYFIFEMIICLPFNF